MCLAVPARIISLNGDQGLADLHGNQVPIATLLTPQAVVGDWVLLHAGFSIQILDAVAAERTWAVLQDAADAAEACSPPGKTDIGQPRAERSDAE